MPSYRGKSEGASERGRVRKRLWGWGMNNYCLLRMVLELFILPIAATFVLLIN